MEKHTEAIELYKEAYTQAIKYSAMTYTTTSSNDYMKILSNELFFQGILFDELKERGLLNRKTKFFMRKNMRKISYFLLMNDNRCKNNEKIKKEMELLCLNNSLHWMRHSIVVSSTNY